MTSTKLSGRPPPLVIPSKVRHRRTQARNLIKKAITVMRHGGVIIYPTETAYALGCDATNRQAVSKIFKLKGRSAVKTLPLIVASNTMAAAYVTFGPTRLAGGQVGPFLTARYWPGPLTIVAPAWRGTRPNDRSVGRASPRATGRLSLGVVARDGTVALRVSSHPVARALSRGLGRPIVATSANRSLHPPAYTVLDALKGLRGTPDCVLNAGRLPRRKPSTMIKIENGRIKVLRQGSIKIKRVSSRA